MYFVPKNCNFSIFGELQNEKGFFKQLFFNLLNKLLHKTNCLKKPFSILQLTKNAKIAIFRTEIHLHFWASETFLDYFVAFKASVMLTWDFVSLSCQVLKLLNPVCSKTKPTEFQRSWMKPQQGLNWLIYPGMVDHWSDTKKYRTCHVISQKWDVSLAYIHYILLH